MSGVREIPLTKGKVAIVDAADYALVSQHKWRARKSRNTWYAVTSIKRSKTLPMHRLIMGAKKGQLIDHKDRDGLNNQRENLRFATHQQNTVNRPTTSKHGFRGLGFHPECKVRKWQAAAKVSGRVISFGMYETKEEAARAYDREIVKYHGEFAVLNFPEGSALEDTQ